MQPTLRSTTAIRPDVRRRRLAVIGAALVVGIGGGWALASGSGSGDGGVPAPQQAVPNSGSYVPGGNPQREVAVQPRLAEPAK
jgi:hypothetical protein